MTDDERDDAIENEQEPQEQENFDDMLLTDEEPTQQQREDYKARAIRAETELDLLRRQNQQPQAVAPEQVDEVAALETQIEELEQTLDGTAPKDEAAFWKRIETQEKLVKLNRQLTKAIKRSADTQIMNVQSGSVVQQYKARYANDPVFQQVLPQWEQMVNGLNPDLRTNPGMLDMLRTHFSYQYLEKHGGRMPQQKKASGVGAAPSGAYAPEKAVQAQQQKQAVAFKSDQHAKVAAFYGMSAEDYYSAKFNEIGPDTEGNGIQIMDLPAGSRRSRRG
jgi:hypothetical protein